uniref:BTB domain-containing protein n=1 Tax=Globodera rostochiensis TaxID=31243 RepID=A0A914GVR0_GLORO
MLNKRRPPPYGTPFSELEFTFHNETQHLQIRDIASRALDASGPLAQIVSWNWDNGRQEIQQTLILDKSGSLDFDCSIDTSIIVRILKKRELVENPCPPLDSMDYGFIVQIAEHHLTVSAHWLMCVSPFFYAMINRDMKEKQQGSVNLSATFGTMEQFLHFMDYISPNAVHGSYCPNPKTVIDLLVLAEQYQIEWLKRRCDEHLVNCVELQLVERLRFADIFHLPKLKGFFLRSLDVANLRKFLKANHAQLSSLSISNGFLWGVINRICDEE